MKGKKIFIGGMVDARLKRTFLKELRLLNQHARDGAKPKTTQSQFMAMLLAESVAARNQTSSKPELTSERPASAQPFPAPKPPLVRVTLNRL